MITSLLSRGSIIIFVPVDTSCAATATAAATGSVIIFIIALRLIGEG